MSQPDLTTDAGILTYLTSLPRTLLPLPLTATQLSGGNANFVFRVTFDAPLKDGSYTAVVKHAEGFGKYDRSIVLSVERMKYEHRVLTLLTSGALQSCLTPHIRVPIPYHFDPDASVLVLQDCGSHENLKTYLSTRTVPDDELREIGAALGGFLKALHTVGRERKADLVEWLRNDVAKEIIKTVIYDAAGDMAHRHGIDPDRVALIRSATGQSGKEVTDAEDTLIMGDFWPGNILVSTHPTSGVPTLWIVDWEVNRYSHPAQDIAQFSAEIMTLCHFRNPAAVELLKSFHASYGVDTRDAGWMRVYGIRFGLHLMVFTGMAGWTEDEGELK
ncbi:hypothetical protein HK104_001168, partial [Borealophlyctis nickersoniae]